MTKKHFFLISKKAKLDTYLEKYFPSPQRPKKPKRWPYWNIYLSCVSEKVNLVVPLATTK